MLLPGNPLGWGKSVPKQKIILILSGRIDGVACDVVVGKGMVQGRSCRCAQFMHNLVGHCL